MKQMFANKDYKKTIWPKMTINTLLTKKYYEETVGQPNIFKINYWPIMLYTNCWPGNNISKLLASKLYKHTVGQIL